jgi:xanthine dehydrogenase small subunit
MRDDVRFLLNGAPVSVRCPDPTLTLLDWLRMHRRLTGTKEGCAEGDCGACTVMAVDASGRPRAINACITFLPMIDSCALVTVEGLGGDSPVQLEIVEQHGSQCGFCTPGIVMSIHTHHARAAGQETTAINDTLAGNLCRCTGYGPIISAAKAACAAPQPALPTPPADTIDPLGYTVATPHGPRSFHAPTTLDALARLCAAHPEATILAGATDVGLWVTKQQRRRPSLISVMQVKELQAINQNANNLTFGAAVRYADALQALTYLHPTFRDYLRRLGATQVRDSGTVVGNIANGSPIGDMPPALIALGATITLRHADQTRTIPLEDFFLAYGKQDRAPGEIVTHVSIPAPPATAIFAAEKISKRFDQDISAVSAGFLIELNAGQVTSARLAYGGLAGTSKRATQTEAALTGQPWTEATVRAAIAALAHDFTPLTDMRASAAYRLEAVGALLLRVFHESQCPAPRLAQLESVAHG